MISTPSFSTDDSFVVAKSRPSQMQGGVGIDSFISPESEHASFMKSTETSFVSVPPKRRRSIRESQYESLLLSENKRISSYSSLFQSSEVSGVGSDPIQSLHIPAKPSDVSVSSLSVSNVDSSLQELSLRLGESVVAIPDEKSLEGMMEKSNGDLQMEQSEIHLNSDIREQSLEMREELEESQQELEQESEQESGQESQQELEQESEQGSGQQSQQEFGQESQQELEQESQQELEQESQQELEQESQHPSDHESLHQSQENSIDSNSLSSDVSFVNSQEEETLRELLLPSQPSQLDEETSLMNSTLMPPPSSSLFSRLRIPSRTKIHTHYKKSHE